MKPTKIAGILIAVLIAAAALLLTIGIPSGAVTSAIQSRVERDTGYRIAIAGASKVSLFPGFAVTLNDVTVQNPNDRNPDSRFTIGNVRAELALGSVIAGKPHVTELTLTKPELRVPLIRDRNNAPAGSSSGGSGKTIDAAIDRITIKDGVVVMANAADRVEDRIDRINAEITIDPERRIHAIGGAQLAGKPAKFEIKAAPPAADAQPVPVDFKLDAPDLLSWPLAAKAEVRLRGALLQINGLSGTLGDGAFNGWASADLAGKPRLKLDLDFQRLDLGNPRKPTAPGAPWSDARFDLSGLNYVDAEIRLSAAELNLGAAHFAPASIDAKLVSGAVTAQFAQIGVYGGEAEGQLGIDASQRTPTFSLRGDLNGVRALPLLSGLAEFDKIDGKMQAKLALRASGDSARAILSTIAGTAFVNVRDGEIRGLNVARMIRNLTTTTLSGWQENGAEVTDLAQLGASFRIEQGKAATADLTLAGPLVRMTGAGTIDLGAKTLSLKVEPKLVLTTQGQSAAGQAPQNGAAAEPVGLGIPVVIEGPWASPRIFPDAAGILDNPDAAYGRLREMGKGLFGALGGGGAAGSPGADNPLGGALGESIGRLIQQGLQSGAAAPSRGAQPAQPPAQQPGAAPAPDRPDSDAAMNAIMKQLFGR
ncbi:AsmA family protein [Rhodopseudomonas pseudopalustris]|uniref:AsmA protein n=1 Tax=Rhodopseudomonas pseudopalustris TaxID=1513892 RepID=A0A1H8TLE7_9BRAD|nr:AsmA family protein [Rhodopseudomonas pseudopalustris]SEO91651.1 AsmA protein [Rhodopseudomonas pseudopalustris]